MVYVSITGLRLKGLLHGPRFYWHAIGSMRQAKAADGNLHVEVRTIDGVQHTLSVWRDEGAMRRFLTAGAHLKAMRAFHSIATGSTVGFEADIAPNWSEAHAIWKARGEAVGG